MTAKGNLNLLISRLFLLIAGAITAYHTISYDPVWWVPPIALTIIGLGYLLKAQPITRNTSE